MTIRKRKYNCITCPLKTDCFKVLSEEELKLIDDSRLEIKYNKGEIICKQGGFANNILHIPEGTCKIYIENNEKNLILDIVNYNFLIGLNTLFYSNILEFSAAVLDNSVVCSINKKAFVKIASGNTTFANSIMKELNRNHSILINRISSLTQKQLHGKIADAILYLSKVVYKKNPIEFKMSRRDIADFTGMSTESAIRILKEFHYDKIIKLEGKKLKVISYSILEKLSEIG